MKTLLLSGLLLMSAISCAALDTIRTTAGTPYRFSSKGLTAGYTLDTDCADVMRDGDGVNILGKRSCMTHFVAVVDDVPTEYVLIVVRPAAQMAQLRESQLRARGVQESGSISTVYGSNPSLVGSTLELSRTQGEHTASVSLEVDNGYGFGSVDRQTTVPRASIRFSSATSSVTILDNDVKDSPLSFEGIRLRGLHIETPGWYLHGGLSSLTNFRQRLYDEDPEGAVETGYRFALTKNFSMTPSVEWIRASRQYVAGLSGAIGAMKLEYLRSNGLSFQAQTGVSARGSVGVAGDAEIAGVNDHLHVSVRSTPMDFPALSMSRSRGFDATGSWTRRLTNTLTLDSAGTRDVYSLFDGTSQSNSNWSSRLQWHVKHFSLNSGYSGSSLSRRNSQALTTTAIPVGANFDSRVFGNSFLYQFSRNGVTDTGSSSMRDTIRIKVKNFTLSAYASRQTQAPTLDYVLLNLPWLRDAILSSGATVSTPEEVQQFISSHSELIAAGYLRDLTLNVSPVHQQVGANANWASKKNGFTARLEWRLDEDARLTGRVISQYELASVSLRLGRATELFASGSYFSTELGNTRYHQPAYNLGIRRRFGVVPAFLNHWQEHGSIHGLVFQDATGQGVWDCSSRGLGDVTVILDGYRRIRTNRYGYYSFGAVSAGKHSVEIQYNSEDPFLFTSSPSVETTENSTVNFGVGEQKPRLFGAVLNDAGMPVANVRLRVGGTESHELISGPEGNFSWVPGKAGDYIVTLDAGSLPPSYLLDDIKPQKVQIKRGRPVQTDFIVQALRTISGHVACSDRRATDLKLIGPKLNPAETKLQVDDAGNYVARGLASGKFQLVVRCNGSETTRDIEIGPEPVALHGIDLPLGPITWNRK